MEYNTFDQTEDRSASGSQHGRSVISEDQKLRLQNAAIQLGLRIRSAVMGNHGISTANAGSNSSSQ
jgi:hypothetical protein